MASQVLQEVSKQSIVVSKYDEATLAWHEGYITVLTEKGVHIFELTHNISCLEKEIDCFQAIITHPKSSPVSGLFTSRVLNKKLRNVDQTEMIVDHSLWPHNSQLMQEMSTIIDFKWSPVGFVSQCESVLAILTNVGVVEIYSQQHFKWQCVIQISELLAQECNIQSQVPIDFKQAQGLTHMFATSAMCWSTLNPDRSCFFVTAQKNGNINFWLITDDMSAKTIGTLQVESCEMQSMLWIPVNSSNFLLVCSNILGQIIVFQCQFQNEVIELVESTTIWPHKDKMISNLLEYIEINQNIVLVCNKNRHLVLLLFDKESNVLSQYVNNICDYRITSISKVDEDIYITTVNCKIYKLNMAMIGSDLNINLDLIQYPGATHTHELYGFVCSPNKVLTVLCIADRKVNSRKDPLKYEIVFTSTIENLNSLTQVLLSNPTKVLTKHWDVIEALRYRCFKTKKLPALDYEDMYDKAVADMYILKIYRILCTICDSLKKSFKLGPEFQLPENNIENIKEEILVANAEKVLHKYSEKFKQQGKLIPLETEYFVGAKKFLEYFFKKNKKNLVDVMDENVMNILNEETSFICQCCDEEVTGFKCPQNHLNMFCALTFTPIESDNYLFCKWCNLTAREELFSENPLCLFCDLPLLVANQIY